MQFEKPLKRVRLLRRYKRFLADVYSKEMDLALTIHCPNSGSLKGIFEEIPEPMAWMSESSNPRRQLPYTLEMIETVHGMVGVNTQHPNALVFEAIQQGSIEPLLGYTSFRREVSYGVDGNSRIDLLLESPDKPPAYVEVKNVSMRQGDYAAFPDAITSRGTKHLLELVHMANRGCRAVMVYVCQRRDCQGLRMANDIDPLYAETLQKAMKHGVEVLAYQCHVSPEAIVLHNRMEFYT